MAIKYSVAVDKDNNKIEIENAKSNSIYYCPFCGKEVIAKNNGKIREHHFAHKDVCTETWNYDNKTEWHKHWQSLFPNCTEELVKKGDTVHIADVLINNCVIEFQHSPMKIEEFRERNDFYSSLGYKVIWIFDLIEKVEKDYIAINKDDNWISTYKYSKSPIRDMEVLKENAVVFIQTHRINSDSETKVLHQLIDGSNHFSKFASDEDNVLTPMEFKKIVVDNTANFIFNRLINKFITNNYKDNNPFILEEDFKSEQIKYGPTTITELWNTSYYSLIAENIENRRRVYLRGTDGCVDRDRYGNVFGCYCKFNGYNYDFYNKCSIWDANKPIWRYISSKKKDMSYIMSSISSLIKNRQQYNRELIHWEKIDKTKIGENKYDDILTFNELLKKYRGSSNWFVAECLSNNEFFYFKYDSIFSYGERRRIDYCNIYAFSNKKMSYLDMFPINDYIRYELNNSSWKIKYYKPMYHYEFE